MNLLELSEITEMLNDVVEAIHHILNIEVTIIDGEFNRIAGTGRYACEVGGKVSSGSVFSEAVYSKQSFIVDQPGVSHICCACENKGKCSETAQVCTPILLNGDVVGVIGLVAFDNEQKERILNQGEQLLAFLENMAKLIALKVKEVQQAKELQVLTDCIEDLLISINRKGTVIRANSRAKSLDNRLSEISEGAFIHVFGEEVFRKIISGERQFQLNYGKKDKHSAYDVKVQTVDISGQNIQYVISMKPVKEVIRTINRWIQDNVPTGFDSILGKHPLLMQTIELAKRTAVSSSTILIQGESGTGKEMFARAIHSTSLRAGEVFLPINCAAIPEPLLESELFGYEEGAFTGAAKGGRIGKFEQAHKGTLFLDEIGDLPLHIQAKLLRVLQDGSFYRVGGKQEVKVDVRLLTATNRALEQMVKEGEFREDLYYRINVIPLWTPALRDRRSDIPILSEAFVKKYNERLSKNVEGISEEALAALSSYSWRGNVRELENAIEYGVNFCSSRQLQLSDLPRKVRESEIDLPHNGFEPLEATEKRILLSALEHYGSQKSGVDEICRVLAISRATFYRKLKLYSEKE